MGCPNHPSAATGAHPSKPNEKRCAKCGTLVAGPASAPRHLSNGRVNSGCVVLLLVALASVVLLALPGRAHAVANMGDSTAACDWTWTQHADNNNFWVVNNADSRLQADYSIQTGTAPGCDVVIRSKTNIECWTNIGSWVHTNCTVDVIQSIFRNGQESWLRYLEYSTGSDGVGTLYGAYDQMWCSASYQGKTWFFDAQIGVDYVDMTDGYYGASHPYYASTHPAC